ncbi:hypothetical protein BJF84_21260 [Rhodococcus sp. CUA-806]|nr:hypothetical protein BJF84_21260 [Rhodococcus sp. CUA-806]
MLDTTDWMDLVTDANGRIARGITPQGDHFLRLASSAVVPGAAVSESSLPASALTAAAPIDLGRRQSKFAEVTGTTPNRSLYVNDIFSGKRVLIASTGDPRDPIMFPDGFVHWTDNAGAKAARGDGIGGTRLVGSDMTKIAGSGGSLTQGVGATSNQGYMYLLAQELTSKTVFNGGRAGETSACANLRSGALTLAFAAFTIPAATTAVTVTAIVDIDWPSDQDFTWTGTIGGIAGTLAHSYTSGATTFTRTTAGTSTPVAAGTAFVSSTASHFDDVTILHFNGQNEMKVQSNVFGSVFDRLRKAHLDAVASLTPHAKRFLILGSTTSSTQITGTWQHSAALAIDAWLAATYPDNFVNLRSWLIANGLSLQSLTPTTADNTAIAGNTIPPQLLTDGIHYTDATHAIVKTKIVAELTPEGGSHDRTAHRPAWLVYRRRAHTAVAHRSELRPARAVGSRYPRRGRWVLYHRQPRAERRISRRRVHSRGAQRGVTPRPQNRPERAQVHRLLDRRGTPTPYGPARVTAGGAVHIAVRRQRRITPGCNNRLPRLPPRRCRTSPSASVGQQVPDTNDERRRTERGDRQCGNLGRVGGHHGGLRRYEFAHPGQRAQRFRHDGRRVDGRAVHLG